MEREFLLISFIHPNKIKWFVDYLINNFGVKKESINIYTKVGDTTNLVVIFNLFIPQHIRLNFKDITKNTIAIHKKHSTYYSINALNKLIENNKSDVIGNIDHESVKIDWDKYDNTLILINKGELIISKIIRVFPT